MADQIVVEFPDSVAYHLPSELTSLPLESLSTLKLKKVFVEPHTLLTSLTDHCYNLRILEPEKAFL